MPYEPLDNDSDVDDFDVEAKTKQRSLEILDNCLQELESMSPEEIKQRCHDTGLDFDVEKIEQMEVELEECSHCKGIGSIYNGIIYCWCPKCCGTGEVPKAKGGNYEASD